MLSEHGLEIGDDDWWKEAEKRVLRQARRDRRRAWLRRAVRYSPVALALVAVIAAGSWVYDRGAPSLPGRSEEAGEAVDLPVRLTADELSEPFVQTPAQRFPAGPEALVAPPGVALGRHSAAVVSAHLKTAAQLLVLSRLDPRMVERRDPSAFLALLAPSQRGRSAPELAGDKGEALVEATRLAPGSTLLAPPRFHGAMSAKLGRYGEVEVATDYVFIYPLKPAGPVYDRMQTHVIVRAKVSFSFLNDRRWSDADQGVSLGDSSTHFANIDCAQAERGLLAAPSREVLPGGDRSGDDAREREDYYRTDLPVPTADDCQFGPPSSPPPTPPAEGTTPV